MSTTPSRRHAVAAAVVAALTVALVAGPAAAHPGHGGEEPAGGALHWFAHLDHVLVLLAVTGVVAATTLLVRRRGAHRAEHPTG